MRRLSPRQAREVIIVTPAGGQSSDAPLPGDPVPVRVVYSPGRKLVRDREGVETVAEVTVLAAPEHNPDVDDLEQLLSPGTAVTVRGDHREVISSAPAMNRGRVIYVAVSLT
ncbi:hypothetical protein G7075_00005 [Phycicoccus sp. HDW14]|uniref:hypothetical protein n=1 Tax=Phycicoccus sp. HDW14 TaxID=2714941 RepID=UPI00140A0342|nr:hypothetical protein [Phycicoccus sp. HDW14]QIM19879.1 hypothetical protein G7075_00005 [Phycicoccus sp. HDW14]